jgi:hypothetical protein
MNNKTDKYILNIIEHNHLQNTMFTVLQICIQEQHDIDINLRYNDQAGSKKHKFNRKCERN